MKLSLSCTWTCTHSRKARDLGRSRALTHTGRPEIISLPLPGSLLPLQFCRLPHLSYTALCMLKYFVKRRSVYSLGCFCWILVYLNLQFEEFSASLALDYFLYYWTLVQGDNSRKNLRNWSKDHGCIRLCLQLNIILSLLEYLQMISSSTLGPSRAAQRVEKYISLQQNETGNVKCLTGLLHSVFLGVYFMCLSSSVLTWYM